MDGFVGLNTLVACSAVGECQAQVQWVSFHEKKPLTLLCTNCCYQLSVLRAREDLSGNMGQILLPA